VRRRNNGLEHLYSHSRVLLAAIENAKSRNDSERRAGTGASKSLILRTHRVLTKHNSRKPARCHRTTVSGVTRINDPLQPDQTFRKTTQNSLSTELSRGRGRCACRARSCCRSARFSRRSSSRERNTERTQPSRCRKPTDIRK